MIRNDTARNIITDLTRSCHPDEPILILCVTANDLKQRLADEHPGTDCAEPGDATIAAAMAMVASAMRRIDEDSSLEDRIIDVMPPSACYCPHCGRELDPGESLCDDDDCPRHDNA